MRMQTLRLAVLAVVACGGVIGAGASPAEAAGPVVRSFSPVSGTIGTTVIITGSRFSRITRVTFGHAASRFKVTSPSTITAVVPASASTGPITVTGPSGTGTSPTRFRVTPGVVLSAGTGPPTTTVAVSGAGFGGHRAVDIYFDTRDKALASTSGNGTFSNITLSVPASAVPGTHYITAVQRGTGRSAQARFLVDTDWAQFRYSNSHSGFNPFENVLSRRNVAGMDLAWSVTTGVQGAGSSPAVVNGVVYIGSDTGLHALRAATGAQLWSFPNRPGIFSSPAVVNGVVYASSFDKFMYAIRAATGAKLWSFRTGGLINASPAVVNGVVYIGSDNMYALNAATGAEIWSFPNPGGFISSPAVADGVVYVGSDDHNVYALNAATGAEIWSFPTQNSVDSSPAVAHGVVYVGSLDGNVYALNAATGAMIWTFSTASFLSSPSPAVAHGVVYIGSSDGNVYALNAATGAKLWSFPTGGIVNASPAVANGVVYIGSQDANVYALNATSGAELWNFPTAQPIESSPAVANGAVYIGSGGNDGHVRSFDLPAGLTAISRPTAPQLHPNYALRPQNGQRS